MNNKIDQMVSLAELRRRRPTDESVVAALSAAILAESRSRRLADLRKEADLTQEEVAARIGVDQPRISRIERGELARTEVGSLAAYAEALGGRLELFVHIGDVAYPIEAHPIAIGNDAPPVTRTPVTRSRSRKRRSSRTNKRSRQKAQ